jgi:drug/metabolite transporter (DMT)-like permease
VLFGVGSALGQSLGAVVSRKAYLVAAAANFPIDGGSAAYQRILGGVLMTWIGFFLLRKTQRPAAEMTPVEPLAARWKRGWPMVMGNALAGPVFGVGCYQWALKDTPSGIVLPIVAASPLVTMILSFFMEGLRPKRRAVIGGVLAVVGAVALARVRT